MAKEFFFALDVYTKDFRILIRVDLPDVFQSALQAGQVL
jgi:hypothetical protein